MIYRFDFPRKHLSAFIPYYFDGKRKTMQNGLEAAKPQVHEHIGVSRTILSNVMQSLKRNKIKQLPKGARVYFPKHVKFARSRFRHFARNNAQITQKVESATAIVVDFLFLYQIVRNSSIYNHSKHPIYYHGRHYSDVGDIVVDERVYNKKDVIPELANYQWLDRIQGLETKSTGALEGLDELIDIVLKYPGIKIISYDWLNANACTQKIESMSGMLSMLKMLDNAIDKTSTRLALSFIAGVSPIHSEISLWIVLNTAWSMGPKKTRQYNTTLHYNAIKRHLMKMDVKYGLGAGLKAGVCWTAGGNNGTIEDKTARVIKKLVYNVSVGHNAPENPPTVPMFVTKWFIGYQLERYVSKPTNMFTDKSGRYRRMGMRDRLRELMGYIVGWVTLPSDNPSEPFQKVSKVLGLNLEYLLRYLLENYDEQTQSDGRPQLREEMCEQAKDYLPGYSYSPE